MIKLLGLPVPPSHNECYTPVVLGGKPRLKKSRAYEDWLMRCEHWRLVNLAEVTKARATMQTIQQFSVDAAFILGPRTLYHQDGSVRRYDVANRAKCLHDYLALLLGRDDRYIWTCTQRKVQSIWPPGHPHHEFVDVTIERVP